MADWGDLDDYFDDSDTPDYKDILFGNSRQTDQHALDLFEAAVFDKNDAAYTDLLEYMHDVYGINFEDVFEWQDFRAWYETQ